MFRGATRVAIKAAKSNSNSAKRIGRGSLGRMSRTATISSLAVRSTMAVTIPKAPVASTFSAPITSIAMSSFQTALIDEDDGDELT